MRTRIEHGRKILCHNFFKPFEIKAGQQWQCSSGGVVEVVSVDENAGDVFYRLKNGQSYTKDSFSFQCRYSLIVGQD